MEEMAFKDTKQSTTDLLFTCEKHLLIGPAHRVITAGRFPKGFSTWLWSLCHMYSPGNDKVKRYVVLMAFHSFQLISTKSRLIACSATGSFLTCLSHSAMSTGFYLEPSFLLSSVRKGGFFSFPLPTNQEIWARRGEGMTIRQLKPSKGICR